MRHHAPRAVCVGLAAALWGVLGETAGAQASIFESGAHYNVAVTSLRDMPFRTVVRQQYDYSCGSAALATLLSHHYGLATGEADVFQAMYSAGDQEKIRQVGFSLLDMKRYLEGRGFKAAGYEVSLDELMRSPAPAITVITVNGYRHFVVIKGVRDGRILVGDPAKGLATYTADEFAQVWQGITFEVEDSREAPVFNSAAEWRADAKAPLGEPLSDGSLASFTRELPPLYQVSPTRMLP